MSQQTSKTTVDNVVWSSFGRYKVGMNVSHNGSIWANGTGKNSEPGVGSDWVGVGGGSGGVVFKNIDALKSNVEFLEDGKVVDVSGYYAVGDGGGGQFYWDEASTETDNGGTIIKVTSVVLGRWIRVYDENISVRFFGAKGDGTTDDSDAIHSALDFVKSVGATLFVPVGEFRVTKGYTNSEAYKFIKIKGQGSNRENIIGASGQLGSCIVLDSTSETSYFFKNTSNCQIQVEGMIFKCNQYVMDRVFFDLETNSHHFIDVNFESVEKPIYYPVGSYFQSASFTNVQFRRSGTIHSATNNLVGTLLVLNNVNHESTVPENSEKIVCNLQGIRQIEATNFLLEGALSSNGWTILNLDNQYDSDWSTYPLSVFDSHHNEWSGSFAPLYLVNQENGSVTFNNPAGFVSPTRKYRINNKGKLTINGSAFINTIHEPIEDFEIVDEKCIITLNNCAVRSSNFLSKNIVYNNCNNAHSEYTKSNLLFSNNLPETLVEFNGGYFNNKNLTIANYLCTSSPSYDSVYGRKFATYTVPNSCQTDFKYTPPTPFKVGDLLNISFFAKIPNYTSGIFRVIMIDEFNNQTALKTYNTDFSGELIELSYGYRLAFETSYLTLRFLSASVSDFTGNLEIYSLNVSKGGSSIKQSLLNSSKNFKNIVTKNNTMPTLGEWRKGDKVLNTNPSELGTTPNKYTVNGWLRLTDSSNHVLNTDWVEMRTLTGN